MPRIRLAMVVGVAGLAAALAITGCAAATASATGTAAVPIVAGSGTGSYRGITGIFTVTGTIDEVDVKPLCNGTSKFLFQVAVLAGSGTVSF